MFICRRHHKRKLDHHFDHSRDESPLLRESVRPPPHHAPHAGGRHHSPPPPGHPPGHPGSMEDTASAIPISPPGYSAAPVSASYPSHSRHPFPIFRGGGDNGRDLRDRDSSQHYSPPHGPLLQRARSKSPPSQRFKYSPPPPPPPSQSRNQATPTSRYRSYQLTMHSLIVLIDFPLPNKVFTSSLS